MDGDEPESATNVPVQLTNNTAGDSGPTWSPDGSKIAFYRDTNPDPSITNMDIHVMNVVDTNADGNGDSVIRLTKHAARDVDPTWSPNGTKIAFESRRVDGFTGEIFVMKPRPEGKRNRPVNLTKSSAHDYGPSWSPDGTRIAFARGYEPLDGVGGEVGYAVPEIYTMKADGTDQLPMTESQEYSDEPVWSPDGSKIAFSRSTDLMNSSNYNIFVMSSTGSIPINRTNRSAFDFAPNWQALPE